MISVYIETSLIGYLTSRRSSNQLVASHQQVTPEWLTQQEVS